MKQIAQIKRCVDQFFTVSALLLITSVTPQKSELHLPNFASEIIKLSSHWMGTDSRAKGHTAINIIPLRCPWFPASSAVPQPSGRSDQSHYPNEDEENKTKKKPELET